MNINIGNFKIIITENYEEMSKKASDMVISQVIIKPDSNLGLATGGTPVGMYKEIIRNYELDRVDFSKVKSFNLDEYYPISRDNNQSYTYYMNTNLFNHINILKENIHIPNSETNNVIEECENYDKMMEDCGGIDLQILGIGNNGHIGFNEPDTYFEARTHLADLNKETIEANSRYFEKKEDVPKKALSMGIGSIMKAKKIVLLASGESKAKAVEKMIFGKIEPGVPASILQLHEDVIIILDKEAASLIINKK